MDFARLYVSRLSTIPLIEIGLESLRTDRIFLFLRAAMAMIVWNEPGNLGTILYRYAARWDNKR